MAITVYCGVMGSGKSYEAVKSAILPALAAGRRVVTNIDGIDELRCHQYLIKKGHDPAGLGRIVHFKNEDLRLPNFFPVQSDPQFLFDVPDWIPKTELAVYAESFVIRTGKTFGKVAFQSLLPDLKACFDCELDLASVLLEASSRDWKNITPAHFRDRPRNQRWIESDRNAPPVVQPGDFVVVDECWHFWSDAQTIDAAHMIFFRMHRHYTHPQTGQCCDMLLMIQDFASLNRFIRGVCELVIVFSKLKSLGLFNSYRTEVFDQKPVRRNRVSISPLQRYDKQIFPLYKSYDSGAGSEKAVDSRQVFYKSKLFLLICVLLVASLCYLIPAFYTRLQAMRNPAPAVQKAESHVAPPSSTSTAVSAAVQRNNESSEFRLVCILSPARGDAVAILQAKDGRFVRIPVSAGVIDGWQTVVVENGQRVSFNFSSNTKAK